MQDEEHTKAKLLQELDVLRRRVCEFEQSEKQLKELFENAVVGIYRTTPDGRFILANTAFVRMLGFSSFEELSGEKVGDEEFTPGYPRSTFKDLIEKKGKVIGFESSFMRRDGTTIFVRENARVVRDSSGRVLYYEGVVEDITERKKAEEALRESQERYRALVDNTILGITLIDTNYKIIMANTMLAKLFNKPASDFVGKNCFREYEKREAVCPHCPGVLAMASGETTEVETQGVRDDGSRIYVRNRAIPFFGPDGVVKGFIEIIEDIYKRKKMEEELREKEKKWTSLTENTNDVIMIVDNKGKLQYINKTIPPYIPKATVGKSVYEYVPKEQHDTMRNSLTNVFKTGKPETYEVSSVIPKLGTLWFSTKVVPIKIEENVVNAILISTDITERKKAEDALQKSEESGRAILDATTESVLLIDKQGTILAINKTAAQRFCRSVEELVGLNVLNAASGLISPALLKSRREQINKVVRSGKSVRFEDRRKGKIFDNSIYPIFDEKGQVTRLAIFARDITEQRKAEEMLRELKYRYQNLFETTPIGVGVATREGKVLECNKAMLQMTGYSLEEFKQINLADTYQEPRSRQMLLRRLQKDGFVRDFEVQLKRKDGATYYASLTIAPITLDGRDVLLTAQEDITERKRNEDSLDRSENRYRTLLENLPQKVFLKDRNSVYISCNENYAGDMKIKPEEITGKTDYDFYPKQLTEKYRADDKRIMDGGKTEDIEEKYILKGQEVIVHTVKTPVKDAKGNIIGILGIFWDITRQKQAEEELEKYREKMAQAERLASLGALSATFAHELTQPLTVINLSIENVLAELKAASRNRSVIEQLEDGLSGVVNATSIIDRFRNFARKSSEKTFGKVDLKAVAEKITKLLNERARRAKVSLRMKGLGNLPPIYSNERELEQLFFALLDNAIQAADGKKDRKVLVSGTMRDEHIELRFSDDCGGIAPEHIGKIFEPFFTTKPLGEGTGLGLCIVQRIVAQAGGRIRVKNKPGTGLTFFVTLPLGKSRRPW